MMLSRFHALGLVTLLAGCFALNNTGRLAAHPVPRNQHDRTIVVKLVKEDSKNIKIIVAYCLEVDEFTVTARDMIPFLDKVDVTKAKDKRNAFYSAYTRLYAPILASNLVATIDDESLKFTCTKRSHTLTDEKGQVLGHLRSDFVFVAEKELAPDKDHWFEFREGNWELEAGKIDLSLEKDSNLFLSRVRQPDPELKKKDLSQLGPGEDEALRKISLVVRLTEKKKDTVVAGKKEPPTTPADSPEAEVQTADNGTKTVDRAGQRHEHSLVALLHEYEHFIWILLAMSALFGAAHALTPGHGKTLMAAYLVGEHGTYIHAFILGLVTTLTHTGVVILISVGLLFVPEDALVSVVRIIQLVLGGGIAAIGFWLLICRLSGQADHVHIGGGHHHHHGHGHHHHHDHSHGHHHHHHDHDHQHHHDHDHADHFHDEEGNVIVKAPEKPMLGWWALIVMGMQGGIVPCWDAVALLFSAIAMGYLYLALPMVLAFSAGLAAVLVIVGMAVVSSKKFAQSHWGESRLVRVLPILSACIVIAIGIWLCYESVHGFRN